MKGLSIRGLRARVALGSPANRSSGMVTQIMMALDFSPFNTNGFK